MSAVNEWCADKLSELLNEELRISTLQEIKQRIASLPSNEAVDIVNHLELPLVFDCLNDTNGMQVNLACDVLSLCMSNLTISKSTDKYSVPLVRALNHPYGGVRMMALNELHRWSTTNDGLSSLCKQRNLLTGIIKSVTDDDLSVASKAMKIITAVGQSEAHVKCLVEQDVIDVFQTCSNSNEVARLRFYEVLIDIVKTSEGHLKLLQSSGLLMRLLEELQSNDILFLLNVLSLFSDLITCKHGYQFLETYKVLDNVFNNTDPLFESTCGIGAIKLYGHLAHYKPMESTQKYNGMIARIFEKLNEDDLTVFGVALDTIAYIGETNDGKLVLESLGSKMTEMFLLIKKRIVSFPTPVCVRTLNNIETLLCVKESDPRVEAITKKWFDLLDDVPMDFVLKYAKNPFCEIRHAGLSVLLSISEQEWGQNYIKNTAGLLEFLMDRTSETFKECKFVKYSVISNLSKSLTFDQNTLKKFNQFINEGPYFVQPVMEIAVE